MKKGQRFKVKKGADYKYVGREGTVTDHPNAWVHVTLDGIRGKHFFLPRDLEPITTGDGKPIIIELCTKCGKRFCSDGSSSWCFLCQMKEAKKEEEQKHICPNCKSYLSFLNYCVNCDTHLLDKKEDKVYSKETIYRLTKPSNLHVAQAEDGAIFVNEGDDTLVEFTVDEAKGLMQAIADMLGYRIAGG